MIHPVREHIPTYLAAVGPQNLQLAGEIVDGVLAIFFAPDMGSELTDPITEGRAKVGKTLGGFDIVPTVPARHRRRRRGPAPSRSRSYVALYVGGMGSREKNFYNAAGRADGV